MTPIEPMPGAGHRRGRIHRQPRCLGPPKCGLAGRGDRHLTTGFRFALPEGVLLSSGDIADGGLTAHILGKHAIAAAMHFAGSVVVPESVANPLNIISITPLRAARCLKLQFTRA